MRRIRPVETVDKFLRKGLLILKTVFYPPVEACLSTASRTFVFLLSAGLSARKA